MCSHANFSTPDGEDVALGACLREHGVYPHNTQDSSGAERFMVLRLDAVINRSTPLPAWYRKLSLNQKIGPGCCSSEAVAFHYVSVEDMTTKELIFLDGTWKWA